MKNASNLKSPEMIKTSCDLTNLNDWVNNEIKSLPDNKISTVTKYVIDELDAFVMWHKEAILLWENRTRIEKYHTHPPTIKNLVKQSIIYLDCRTNGPAVVAYNLAGGSRPKRYGSNNKWSIHHLYSGKFPYLNSDKTIHAEGDGRHFK